MRIVFFGTPELSVPTLDALVDAGHEVVLVVTQPAKRRGRGSELTLSPVAQAAERLGLKVTNKVADVLEVEADMGVLVAFGRLIKPEILEHVNIINLHPSLLPRWRGATPAEGAILNGDEQTGICLMQLVQAMDEGPVYAKYKTDIAEHEKAEALYERLITAGNELLLKLLSEPSLPEPEPQTGEPTYCGKLSKDDFHVDWQKSAEEIERLVRIGKPWTTFRSKRFLIVDATADGPIEESSPGELHGDHVATAAGSLHLIRVQPEGKPPLDAKAWLNGAQLKPGESFA